MDAGRDDDAKAGGEAGGRVVQEAVRGGEHEGRVENGAAAHERRQPPRQGRQEQVGSVGVVLRCGDVEQHLPREALCAAGRIHYS